MPPSLAERPGAVTAALLLAFASLECWLRLPVLLGAVALYQRDLFLLYFPLVQSVLRAVADGAFPLRDPTSAFGQALLGDPESQVLYPPAWLHLFLRPALAYGWFVSIHSVFGALGAALLARRISGSVLGGLVAGTVWLMSGPLQSLASVWHHMSGAAWIPWVLLGVERVVESKSPRATIELGAILGAQILAGSADMCAMTVLLATFRILLARGWRSWRSWLVSGLIALGLSAGVWLPAGESVVTSGRAALSETTRTFWSLHPLSTLEFFLPVPFSLLPLRPDWKAAAFESREPFLGSMFLGALVFPLCLAALADSRLPSATRPFFGLSALGGFLVSLGKHAPVYGILVGLFPPLGVFRYPSKVMVPVALLLCVLAGIGAASIQRSPRSRSAAALAALALGLAALILMGPARSTFEVTFLDENNVQGMDQVRRNLSPDLLMTVALLGLLLAFVRWPHRTLLMGLLLIGTVKQSASLLADLNPTVPVTALAYKPEHLELMRPSSHGRLMVYDYSLFQGAARKHLGTDTLTWSGLEAFGLDAGAVVATHAYLQPLTGGLWGFEYAWDADLRLLLDRRLARLTTGLRAIEGTPGFVKLLQVSGVERVAALHESGMEGLRLIARQKIFHREALRIFEVPETLPRAFLTTGRKRARGSDMSELTDPAFDARTTVLVEDGPVRPPVPGSQGDANILARKADRIVVESSSSVPAFLTILEGALPGWRVSIDGQPGAVERANAIFLGTEVPAGTHRVEFRFRPASAMIGVSLSALTGLGLFFSLLLARPPGSRG